MYWSRQRLKEMARVALRGSYWKCVLVSLILAAATGAGVRQATRLEIRGEGGGAAYSIIRVPAPLLLFAIGIAIVGSMMWIAFHFLVMEPAEVSCCAFFNRDLYAPAELDEMKKGFLPNYWNVVRVQLFRALFTFLWGLLFVIPGIIKAYEYRMIPYILAEDPNTDMAEAFARSKAMMDGEKWNAFILDLSFIGWFLLSGVTCGILGVFYVNPYYNLTSAALYGALKRKMTLLENGGDGSSGGGAFDAGAMAPSSQDAPFGTSFETDAAPEQVTDAGVDVMADTVKTADVNAAIDAAAVDDANTTIDAAAAADANTTIGAAAADDANATIGAAAAADANAAIDAAAADDAATAIDTAAGSDTNQAVGEESSSTDGAAEETSSFEAEPVLKPETTKTAEAEGPVDAPWVIYAQSQSSPGQDTMDAESEVESPLTPEAQSILTPEAANDAAETDDKNAGSPFEI